MNQGEMRIILENSQVGLEMASLLGTHFNFKKNKGTQQVQSQILATIVNEWKPLLNAPPIPETHPIKKKFFQFLPKLLPEVISC